MAVFNARHYNKIAEVLAQTGRTFRGSPEELCAWRISVRNLARAFKADNPKFEVERFAVACGYDGDGAAELARELRP